MVAAAHVVAVQVAARTVAVLVAAIRAVVVEVAALHAAEVAAEVEPSREMAAGTRDREAGACEMAEGARGKAVACGKVTGARGMEEGTHEKAGHAGVVEAVEGTLHGALPWYSYQRLLVRACSHIAMLLLLTKAWLLVNKLAYSSCLSPLILIAPPKQQ